jgi:UDPglucose 6-dehydrogenase
VSRIFIVGSGVVGSATGRALLRLGHRVTFVDAAPDRVAGLTAEGLDARRALSLAGEPASFVLLCLPIPVEGSGYRLAAIENGARQIGLALAGAGPRHTVVVRSAVPPGTTEQVIQPLIQAASAKREGLDFSLAVGPQFRPRITVVGARNQQVAEQVRDLLEPLGAPGDPVRLFDDPATAELITCPAAAVRGNRHYRGSRPPRRTIQLDGVSAVSGSLNRIPRQLGHR